MSAVKLIFKRSSLLGKRPTASNLEPGEIGINTNSVDPGLFFETNTGTVVKVGPTSYLPEKPTNTPSRGELWIDSDTKSLSVGTDQNLWQKVASPFLGGTNGYTVFVAPEYQNATDSLANDGQTVPFITINRAILEVTKQIILESNSGVSAGNNRYLIVLAPGRHCVVNGPGTTLDNFQVSYPILGTPVTQGQLQQFNPTSGGLILPRGVSIIGLDLEKCEVHPVYVPKYTHPAFPANYRQTMGGPIYENEPLSSIFKWSGNSYESQFSCLDKVDSRVVTSVGTTSSGTAVFRCDNQPHGLAFNDFVRVDYTNSADQGNGTFVPGVYYVSPINSREFELASTSWTEAGTDAIPASQLPTNFYTSTSTSPKFEVQNVYPYFVPTDGSSYYLSSYSHHRLSVNRNASLDELNDFYIKVQKAFPTVFNGTVDQTMVTLPEYDIVAPTIFEYPLNTNSNSVDNSSPYMNMVNVRSNFGMSGGDFDGNIVSGFKSVIVNSSTVVSLQRDPSAYELYSTSTQNWQSLVLNAQAASGLSVPVVSVSVPLQLQDLNEASIPNIRYFYDTLKTPNGQSTGVSDPDNDFRHFGFRSIGANAFLQAGNVYTVGPAVGVWAKDGAQVSLAESVSNFGSVAVQAEGFAGIGTLGGANAVNRGFLQTGIVRPLQLTESQISSDSQKRVLSLGSRVVFVGTDPTDATTQLIFLQRPFDPASILPFSLRPGSAIFVSDGICDYRAFFVTDGSPTCVLSETDPSKNPFSPGGAILRVRVSDSSIPPGTPTSLDIPYIRRFIDPRTPSERSYGFLIESTNPTSQSPQVGSVLRLNQTGQNLSNTIKRNYQFDPGQYGGIAQVFSVCSVETAQLSTSPNFNYKVYDSSQSTSYTIYTTLTDSSVPWTQSTTVPNGVDLVPFNTPQGSYSTFQNKNYYAAENNEWVSLYYDTNFTPINGPTKVSPDKTDSPFVLTSVLDRQEPIKTSWQGYVPDPFYGYYVDDIPPLYRDSLTYMRGAVVPYTEFATQFQIDNDDSSVDMGIAFKRIPVTDNATVMVADSVVTQSSELMTTPYVSSPTFGRPEVLFLKLLEVQKIMNPKQGVSVLQLKNETQGVVEFVRVISLNSNTVQVIRNVYPTYSQGVLPTVWKKGTVVTPCISTGYAEPSVYDPLWSVTKATMVRYYQLMGYSYSKMKDFLTPKFSGERVLLNTELALSPIDGYANVSASWPVEFNNASSVFASNHTWQYVGYYDYSRGLPKYQVNSLPKKLQFDFLSSSTWGGFLNVVGNDSANGLVFLGPIKEAVTAQYYVNESPYVSSSDNTEYIAPPEVQFPAPILVYSVDDISGEFDGSTTSFNLTRGGYPIPATQLSQDGVFVFVGGVEQLQTASYVLQTSGSGPVIPRILFTEAPPVGASCDIRVVTSDDSNDTLEVKVFKFTPDPDGATSSFILDPDEPTLTDLNSFVFLGGVEQNPSGATQSSAAYTISHVSGITSLNFLGGIPKTGTTLEVRGVLSGNKYRTAGTSSVFVTSVDDIATLFNNTRTTFPLTVGGVSLDAYKVDAESMFVSLGGVMQIPVASVGNPLAGLAYTVQVNPITSALEITFAVPPLSGTTCNIRVISSDEFIACDAINGLGNQTLKIGPGIQVDSENQIIGIDPGLISP